MKIAFIRQYDSHGDWMNINGFVRYILSEKIYDEVFLILEVREVRKKHCEMLYSDDPRIKVINFNEYRSFCASGLEFDLIDMRYPDVIGSGDFPHNGKNYSQHNPLFGSRKPTVDKAENTLYYTRHGIDCEVKRDYFYFERKNDLEEEFYNSLSLNEQYSIICEYGDNTIDRKHVKYDRIINLHNISSTFFDIVKVIENCDDIHLIENSVSLFVYHMQYSNLMERNKIHLHAYGRKESHRKCDGPDCNNPFLNMIKCPPLENWEFIY